MATKVYISYTWDSKEHVEKVLEFANRLRADGIDAELDRYVEEEPPEGWIKWATQQIHEADYVIVILSFNYCTIAQGEGGQAERVIEEWNLIKDFILNSSSITKWGPEKIIYALLKRYDYAPEVLLEFVCKTFDLSEAGGYDGLLNHVKYKFRKRVPKPPLLRSPFDPTTDISPITDLRPYKLERLKLSNFKCFDHLELKLTSESMLSGDWTCIAGLNGAGKSTVLEAICLLLLGEQLVPEIGQDRLTRKRRDFRGEKTNAVLRASLSRGEETVELALFIGPEGLDRDRTFSEPNYQQMALAWKTLARLPILSYGPTRNISEYRDTRYASLSKQVRNQMTLFDPLTQVADIDVLIQELPQDSPVLTMVVKLLDALLCDFNITTAIQKGRLAFKMAGAHISALELPDGFRSLTAWLADLCATRQEKFPERAKSGDPSEIEAIVLLDEIDLHLHAQLQRTIVPKLRELLPHVQWIVTTHSPLVIASFDANELVLLDHREEDGVRELDRQIMGFSMEEIYRWLMETPPQSYFVEKQLELAEARRRGEAVGEAALNPEELALLMDQSPETGPRDAQQDAAWRKKMLKELKL